MGNRQQSEAALLQAVAQIIQRDGLGGLGINAIARQSGINKALIYRYFKDLEGLLRAFGESQDFWPDTDEILGPDPATLLLQAPAKILSSIVRNHCEALLKRPLTIEILARECIEHNTLTVILEEIREQRSLELFEKLKTHFDSSPQDIPEPQLEILFGCGALLSAALQYFLIRARKVQIYAGLDIQSDEGRTQIYALIDKLAGNLQANLH